MHAAKNPDPWHNGGFPPINIAMLSTAQRTDFQHHGFLVLKNFVPPEFCSQVLALAQQHVAEQIAPIEYEADTGYPGAPASRTVEGGQTTRRLLQAYARSALLADFAAGPRLSGVIGSLLGPGALLSQAHHNCIMTKQARYSSSTGWHRDSRYWRFARAELVSSWLALGSEQVENGCLWVIPGSHQMPLSAEQFDAAQFFRTDWPANQALLAKAHPVPLQAGDVLLFHSNLLHSAGANQTGQTKYSLVLTYRAPDNLPEPGSRSASLPEVPLPAMADVV
jgi:phytanoyl-CoA hydroxylase